MEDKETTSEYRAFLTAKHKRLFNAPDSIIQAAIHKATGSTIITKNRLIKGESNEVHAIKTETGQEVVIRIHHQGDSAFESERWAIEQCRKVGVPVPDVLFVGDFDDNGKPLSICVESKIPGVSMGQLPTDSTTIPDLLREAGKILSKIHSIGIRGFGDLNKDGEGKDTSMAGVFMNEYFDQDALLSHTHDLEIDPALLSQALEILKAGADKYKGLPSQLTHNDFAPKHLLTMDNKITGVLDFENVGGGDPVRDFARWKFFFPETFPIKHLMEGYENSDLFGADYEERFNLWKLQVGLSGLRYYAEEQNPVGIKLSKNRLAEDIKLF